MIVDFRSCSLFICDWQERASDYIIIMVVFVCFFFYLFGEVGVSRIYINQKPNSNKHSKTHLTCISESRCSSEKQPINRWTETPKPPHPKSIFYLLTRWKTRWKLLKRSQLYNKVKNIKSMRRGKNKRECWDSIGVT